jgi:hypothetical protein
MIPVTQTKVVVKDSNGKIVQNGNCYAAAIASMLEVPITEVPNVEVFFPIPHSDYWNEVMLYFLTAKGWDLCCDDRFRVFHDGQFGVKDGKRAEYMEYCKDKYYLVTGKSTRGVHHITIWKNGEMVHDPHPTREGILTLETFQTIEKIEN